MGYTMAACIAGLRIELRDGGAAVWSDAECEKAIKAACGLLSGWFPQQEMQEYAVNVTGNDTFQLLSNTAGRRLLQLARLELPQGTPIPREPWEVVGPLGARATYPTQQMWRWRYDASNGFGAGEVRLRFPTAATTARFLLWATFVYPDTGAATEFNGDELMFALLLKAATRECLAYLANEQVRVPGANVQWLVNEWLPELDRQIAEARAARAFRVDAWPLVP